MRLPRLLSLGVRRAEGWPLGDIKEGAEVLRVLALAGFVRADEIIAWADGVIMASDSAGREIIEVWFWVVLSQPGSWFRHWPQFLGPAGRTVLQGQFFIRWLRLFIATEIAWDVDRRKTRIHTVRLTGFA